MWGGHPYEDKSLQGGKNQVMTLTLLKGESFGSGLYGLQESPLFNVQQYFGDLDVNIFWIEHPW